MSKININKTNEVDAMRATRQADTKAAGQTKPESAKTGTVNTSGDKLDISNRASEAARLVDTVKEMPDVRMEKVSEFKERITSGNYTPSNEAIADAVLKEEA